MKSNGAKLSQLSLNLSRYHNFTWEVFSFFLNFVLQHFNPNVMRVLSMFVSPALSIKPTQSWWGRLAQFLWIMNWKQNGNEVWLTVNNNPVSWWKKKKHENLPQHTVLLCHISVVLTKIAVSCFLFFFLRVLLQKLSVDTLETGSPLESIVTAVSPGFT